MIINNRFEKHLDRLRFYKAVGLPNIRLYYCLPHRVMHVYVHTYTPTFLFDLMHAQGEISGVGVVREDFMRSTDQQLPRFGLYYPVIETWACQIVLLDESASRPRMKRILSIFYLLLTPLVIFNVKSIELVMITVHTLIIRLKQGCPE